MLASRLDLSERGFRQITGEPSRVSPAIHGRRKLCLTLVLALVSPPIGAKDKFLPLRPLRGLQETRDTNRAESGVLGFPWRRGLTPRGSLECNPEIPAFPGEEN